MADDKNLGVITTKHSSGMRETDKGFKVFDGEIGDTVMMGKKTYIVKAGAAKTDKAPSELDMLRTEAIALGIDGAEKMNKATVIKAIEAKKGTTPPQLPLGDDGDNDGQGGDQ